MTYDIKFTQERAFHLGLVALLTLATACGGSDTETSSSTGPGGGDGTGGMGAAGGSGGMGGEGPSVCEPGETRSCYDGDASTEGVGLCIGGTETCLPDGSGWGACEDQVLPAESDDCNAIGDEDCDGIACSETVWATTIGGTGEFQALEIEVDAMGNTTVLGRATGTVTVGAQTHEVITASDVLVMRFDPAGAPLWMAAGIGTDSLNVGGMALDETGAVYLAGQFQGTLNFGSSAAAELVGFPDKTDIFVAKLDPNGQHVWSRYLSGRAGTITFDPVGTKRVGDLAVDGEGVYVGGTYDGHFGGACLNGCTSSANDDVWIRKLARSDGTNIWAKTGGSPGDDELNALSLSPDGGIVVGGAMQGSLTLGSTTLSLVGTDDPWVASLGADGSVAWGHAFGAAGGAGYVVALDSSPLGIVVSGEFMDAMSLGTMLTATNDFASAFVGLIDSSGNIQWGQAFTPTSVNGAFFDTQVAWNDEGHIYLGGVFLDGVAIGDTTYMTGTNGAGAHLSKLEATGELIWTRGYLPDDIDDEVWLTGVTKGLSNDAHVVGYHNGPTDFGGIALTHDGGYDAFVARVQP